MLILDWQVADLAGAEVLRRAREKLADNAPVLFLTNSSGEDDIVAGMAAGADDYMIKPLRRGELVARVQALLRRAYPTQNGAEQLQFGQYVFETRPGPPADGRRRAGRDAQGVLPGAAVFPQPRPAAVARLHPRGRLDTRYRHCRRAPWTPTFRACATNCSCSPKTVSGWCRSTATVTAWKNWAPEPNSPAMPRTPAV